MDSNCTPLYTSNKLYKEDGDDPDPSRMSPRSCKRDNETHDLPIPETPKRHKRSAIPTPADISKHTSQAIIIKQAKPLVPDQKTLFDLPGEVRNEIYTLALPMHKEQVPLNCLYKGELNTHIQLLQTCSQVFDEARSLMAATSTAYIPVMPGMDWKFGEPKDGYAVPPEVKATAIQALAEFTTVHFHLHTEALYSCSSAKVLKSLEKALNIFISNSASVSAKLDNKKRHAIVHLDIFLPAWSCSKAYGVGSFERLFDIMAKDINTIWDIRYYVPHLYQWLLLDLAQLKGYCRRYGQAHFIDMAVKAEVYGDYKWEEGKAPEGVKETSTPVSEFWPNEHSSYKRVF